MSDAADALTAAVTGMQERLDTLNTTIQTEVQQITAALTTAGTDQALRDAAALAVDRLNAMGQQVDAFNTTVQDIIA
jgi:Skp family chaperone for outer membrane proteins